MKENLNCSKINLKKRENVLLINIRGFFLGAESPLHTYYVDEFAKNFTPMPLPNNNGLKKSFFYSFKMLG